MEDANMILEDRNAMKATMEGFIDNKEKLKELKVAMETDSALKRYVGRQTRNMKIVQNVRSMSMSDKLAYKRKMENCNNTRRTEGVKCVLIKGKNQNKEILYPQADKLEGSSEIYLSSGLVLVYFSIGGKLNRCATMIADEKIFGEAFLRKENMEDFTLDEYLEVAKLDK